MINKQYTFPLSLFLLFFLCSVHIFPQKEFNRWYFGNGAGLDFSSGAPIARSDGKLYTEEGCATISDEYGNLLFYTNGVDVWDKNHQLIANGSGLAGGISSTQSAAIAPLPGNPHKYYIFTVAEKAEATGLSYSVVDLLAGADKKITTKNQKILLTPDIILSSAKPEVVQKNIRLIPHVSEKLAVVKHSNGKDFWVIAHQWNSNAFYAFPVNESGVGKPVISTVGTMHKETGIGANRESIGFIAASPDGKKLCSAICYKPGNDLELFDFDNSSGKISNPEKIPTKGFAYGICFSPDNSKIYVSFLKGQEGIVQYDLNNFNRSFVVARNNNNDEVFGALQRGSDGKIYIAKTGKYLDVIHSPNENASSCKYEKDAVYLNGKYSVYGLPADILTFSETENKTGERVGQKKDCDGKIHISLPPETTMYCVSEIILDAENPGAEFLWSTKESAQKITVKESGKYSVKVTKDGCIANASTIVDFAQKHSVFNYLPEFKPSQNLFNKSFQFSINDVKSFEMKIFSSKGKLIFESDDTKKYWDGKDMGGKELPAGEYNWKIKYNPKCGDRKTETKEGKVKLLR